MSTNVQDHDNSQALLEAMRLKFPTHDAALVEVVRLRRLIARNRVVFEVLKDAYRAERAKNGGTLPLIDVERMYSRVKQFFLRKEWPIGPDGGDSK